MSRDPKNHLAEFLKTAGQRQRDAEARRLADEVATLRRGEAQRSKEHEGLREAARAGQAALEQIEAAKVQIAGVLTAEMAVRQAEMDARTQEERAKKVVSAVRLGLDEIRESPDQAGRYYVLLALQKVLDDTKVTPEDLRGLEDRHFAATAFRDLRKLRQTDDGSAAADAREAATVAMNALMFVEQLSQVDSAEALACAEEQTALSKQLDALAAQRVESSAELAARLWRENRRTLIKCTAIGLPGLILCIIWLSTGNENMGPPGFFGGLAFIVCGYKAARIGLSRGLSKIGFISRRREQKRLQALEHGHRKETARLKVLLDGVTKRIGKLVPGGRVFISADDLQHRDQRLAEKNKLITDFVNQHPVVAEALAGVLRSKPAD